MSYKEELLRAILEATERMRDADAHYKSIQLCTIAYKLAAIYPEEVQKAVEKMLLVYNDNEQ